MSWGIFILNFIINEIKDNDRYDPHRVRIIGRILYNGNDGGYAVDLLWRCTVVAGNFISIKRFSRKSKPNGSINISLYARVSPTLFPLTLGFSIDLYPLPSFFSPIKVSTRETARIESQWQRLKLTKCSWSQKQLYAVRDFIIDLPRCR